MNLKDHVRIYLLMTMLRICSPARNISIINFVSPRAFIFIINKNHEGKLSGVPAGTQGS